MKDLIEIRSATINDSSALADLSIQLGYPTSSRQSAHRLDVILDSKDHALLMACLADDTVIGYVHGFIAYRVGVDPFAEIGGLVVTKEYHRRGVGRRLMAEVEDWAMQNGIRKFRIRSASHREAAHPFYKRLGFTQSKKQFIFDKSLDPETKHRDSTDANGVH
jgi:GNAT superfamily N-acetyltransferase